MNLSHSSRQSGFSRIDLTAMTASVALLGVLFMTTAGVDHQGATSVTCRANLLQLARAWSLYAMDNGDRLPANSDTTGVSVWCDTSFLDFSPHPRNWNVALLTNATLWRYAANPEVWHCPADASTVPVPDRGPARRIRSYSMNASLGVVTPFWAPSYRGFLKTTDLTVPGPSKTFVLIDEHPGSINDGSLAVSMDGFGGSASQRRWVDFPGSHHLGAANLNFADGHLETWKWRDSRTTPPFRNSVSMALNVLSRNNPDVARLQAVTTTWR